MAHTIYQQRLNVRIQLPQRWMRLLDISPGLHREQGFDCSGRARIEGHDSILQTRAKEEGHIDRNQQAVPLRIGHFQIRQAQHAPADTLVLSCRRIVEEDRARIAYTNDASRRQINKVRVLMTQSGIAKLAVFERFRRGPRSSELAQSAERLLQSR